MELGNLRSLGLCLDQSSWDLSRPNKPWGLRIKKWFFAKKFTPQIVGHLGDGIESVHRPSRRRCWWRVWRCWVQHWSCPGNPPNKWSSIPPLGGRISVNGISLTNVDLYDSKNRHFCCITHIIGAYEQLTGCSELVKVVWLDWAADSCEVLLAIVVSCPSLK